MNLANVLHSRADVAPTRIGLVGAGEFGLTLLAQMRHSHAVSVVAVCDLDVEKVRTFLCDQGVDSDRMQICDSRTTAALAIERGKIAIVGDAAILVTLQIDAVIEATGKPEAAAATALSAIENGLHSVLATKEAEVLVGPVLARKAHSAGVVHTPADGDQPSLLIGLVGWARMLGFRVLAAGKSTSARNDAIWDPEARTLTTVGETFPAHGYASAFNLVRQEIPAQLAARVIAGMNTRPIVDDLCEVCIVANHTDLNPDRPGLHVPLARAVELPRIFRASEEGGILGRVGAVDMFRGLRTADEQAFAGGVFVTVETPSPTFGSKFSSIGVPTSLDGRVMLIHNPMHLLGIEATLSALSAVRLGQPTGSNAVRQRFDLIGRAQRDFIAGERLSLVGDSCPGANSNVRHSIEGLEPMLHPAQPLRGSSPLPYYLAVGTILKQNVAAGVIITCDHVELNADGLLISLRREQDRSHVDGHIGAIALAN